MFEGAGLPGLPSSGMAKKSIRNEKWDTYQMPLWTMQNVYS